jgi:hypothetical protein
MKRVLLLVALCGALGFTLAAANRVLAKGAMGGGGGGTTNNGAAPTPKVYHGTVIMVRIDMLSIDIGQDKPIKTNGLITDKTVVTINGKAATVDDLARGQMVDMTCVGAEATKIDIKTN